MQARLLLGANKRKYRGEMRERGVIGDGHIVGRQRRSEANENRTADHLGASIREVDILQVESSAERHVKVTRDPLGVDRGAVAADDRDVVAIDPQHEAAEVVHALQQVDSDLAASRRLHQRIAEACDGSHQAKASRNRQDRRWRRRRKRRCRWGR